MNLLVSVVKCQKLTLNWILSHNIQPSLSEDGTKFSFTEMTVSSLASEIKKILKNFITLNTNK